MRRRSKKMDALYREWSGTRQAWLLVRDCCVCGGRPDDVHEILAGAHRLKAFVEPACWLAVCRPCHDAVQGASLPWQLALKLLSDPANFSLELFHAAWGRPPSAITPAEVLEALRSHLIHERDEAA